MHSILLAIKRPMPTGNQAVDTAATEKWWKAADKLDNAAAPNKGVEILSAGTYLIRADDGLPFLADGIRQAHEDSLQYKVLFFEESPELPKATAIKPGEGKSS